MKNKYLTKSLCITMLAVMVLSSPMSVVAAEDDATVASSDFADGGDTTDAPTPNPTTAPDPEPTTAPDPTTAPNPEPTTAPEPTTVPDPKPTETPVTPEPQPTEIPVTPTPTDTPGQDVVTEAANSVIQRIDALSDVALTLDNANEVQSIRAAYNALSQQEKNSVYNYQQLVGYEQKIAALQKGSGDNDNNGGDITDGTATGQAGTPVYYSSMVSNLHAGKDFYLDSLKENYHLSFSDDFSSVMEQIEKEYKEKNKLTDSSDNNKDGLTTSADSLLVRNWQDVLAVYVYEQSQKGTKEFKLDSSAKDELARIFETLNPIVRDKENITHVSYGNYHVNYYIKQNNIAQDQRTVLKKYTETDCKLLCAIVTDAKGFVRQSVGDDVSEERVNVITAAYSLVGEVGYFWGGKSTTIGEDPSWGTAETVSAAGSPSTGTTRAYGLDCSGFVTWSVINGYLNQDMQSSVGDGTSDQWEKANVVSEQDAQPGDLVFQNGPESGSNNHVGIICGKTDSGDWIAVHCSSSKNGVTVGEAYGASFRYIRQPSFYPTEDELAKMVSDGQSASNSASVDVNAGTDTVSDSASGTDDGFSSGNTATSDEVQITVEGDNSENTGISDGTSGSAAATDTLQDILKKNISVSGSSAAVLPQLPGDEEVQVSFED